MRQGASKGLELGYLLNKPYLMKKNCYYMQIKQTLQYLTTTTNQLILLKHFERRQSTSCKCLIAFQECFQIDTLKW